MSLNFGLKQPETTYNEQKTTWNDLNRPTTSKKWIETTYNKQETTWNDVKLPRVSKKRPKTTYREQKMTSPDLQRTDSNFMEALYLKNYKMEGSVVSKK